MRVILQFSFKNHLKEKYIYFLFTLFYYYFFFFMPFIYSLFLLMLVVPWSKIYTKSNSDHWSISLDNISAIYNIITLSG